MIEYACILITPRAVADNVADLITSDLVFLTNMRVLWSKYWRVDNEKTFDLIYPNLVNKPFKSGMVRNLTGGKSLIVLASGENLFLKLKEIKGKFKYHSDGRLEISGLRLKYQPTFVNNDIDQDGKFEFRFHTTDNVQETIVIITLSTDDQERIEIKKIVPELFKEEKSK